MEAEDYVVPSHTTEDQIEEIDLNQQEVVENPDIEQLEGRVENQNTFEDDQGKNEPEEIMVEAEEQVLNEDLLINSA